MSKEKENQIMFRETLEDLRLIKEGTVDFYKKQLESKEISLEFILSYIVSLEQAYNYSTRAIKAMTKELTDEQLDRIFEE